MGRGLNLGVTKGVTPYLSSVSSPDFTTGLIFGTKSGQNQHSKLQYNRNLSRNGKTGSSARSSLGWNRVRNPAVTLKFRSAAKLVASWKSSLQVRTKPKKGLRENLLE